LVIADMNVDGGQQTVHTITENGSEATFIQVDVSNATEVEAMLSKAIDTYGRLDCAHNNAGIGARPRAPLHEYPEENWNQVISMGVTLILTLDSFPVVT
jgi:NAD(P)-dependent dehydrogenase (short-subunit alcohol dehydrogenase family)